MDRDEILAAVESERLRLGDFLEDLDEASWSVPSLCPGWTVRDVVAHLTIPTRWTVPGLVKDAIRARGSFHRMTLRQAQRRAGRFAPAELVRHLRETAGLDRRMPGSSPMDPLMDVLVHGQDIARPLRRTWAMPADPAVAALAHVAESSFHGGPERLARLRLVATDADFRHGQGPEEVRGPVEDLLLLATGRPAGRTHVSGEGVERLMSRLESNRG